MIARLTGRLVEKQATRLVVDVHGVGYDVQVPLSTFYHLPEPGADVSLRVHTHVREDALSLFGFGTVLEQQVFERLIGVSGIGPKLALAVLSGIDAADLVRAVQAGDVGRLTLIPGVGKKTAERIGLELKGRLPQPLAAELAAGADGPPGDDDAARRPRVGASQSGISSRPCGQGRRCRAEDAGGPDVRTGPQGSPWPRQGDGRGLAILASWRS